MSKKNTVRNGGKIYDTPKLTNSCCLPVIPGYNGGFPESDGNPSYSIGSASEFTKFWERRNYLRIASVLGFQMPETWDKDYTLYVLFRNGYFGLIDAVSPDGEAFGVIPQHCTYSGRNVFYQPTKIKIANPAIKQHNYVLGENAALIKLTPDYMGAWDFIHLHAEILADLTQSLRAAIINNRLNDVYFPKNQSAAQSLMAMLQLFDQGRPQVIMQDIINYNNPQEKEQEPWFKISNEVGKNYIVDKCFDAIETELNQIDRAIGVPVMSDKKERQLTSEVQTSVNTAMTSIDVWIDCLQRSIKKAKEVFPGLQFSVQPPDFTQPEEVKKDEPKI